MKKIFVDGSSGTTGLVINERLSNYKNIEILKIDEDKKKDIDEKRRFLNEADLVFLCLPDEASKASVALIENDTTKVIDASTAYRTDKDWAYGIPELSSGHRERIASATRVSNPGCHASAFNLAVYPLIAEGIIGVDHQIMAHGLTGYSGGGKNLISKYEDKSENNPYHKGPRHYALHLAHKHIPEMMTQTGLTNIPIFTPMVGNFYKGLVVGIPLKKSMMKRSLSGQELQQLYADYYKESYFIRSNPYDMEESLFEGTFDVSGSNDTNFSDLFVFSDEKEGSLLILSRLDNLGKGASGSAIQNMNIMLGFEEWTNLI